MQLLVLVLAGLVFGFAWFGLLVVSSHLPERCGREEFED